MVQLRSEPVASVGDQRPRIKSLTKDDLPKINISRLRATGAVKPDMDRVTLSIGELERVVALAHLHFPNGGGWSLFICPQCDRPRRVLRLTEAGRLACCDCDGLLYRCQQTVAGRLSRIAHLRALLYGGPVKHKRRWLNPDRRQRLEASLRRLLIRQRQDRLERMKSFTK